MTTNFNTNSTDLEDIFLSRSLHIVYFPFSLWSWGNNGSGQLGLGDTTNRSSPVQVGALTGWSKISAGGGPGGGHSLAIKNDGSLWAWGYNYAGQLGLGDRTNRSSPVQVGALTDWSKIDGGDACTLAIKTDGTLWSWGRNSYGQLGLGDITHRSSPVQVGALTDWSKISSSKGSTLTNFSLAIKTDGTLWSWGLNTNGQLGLGNITHRSSPVQVGSLTNWSEIAAGVNFSLATKTDGTLWSWGDNGQGRLGLGNTTDRSSPVQVGALTDWSQVAAGGSTTTGYSLSIKTDGTLWSWGDNGIGQLGLGDITDRSSPVQVGLLTDWSKIAASGDSIFDFSLAIKTDGTLWSWGERSDGALGLDDMTHRSSPVQVGALTDWSQIAAGSHSLGIR